MRHQEIYRDIEYAIRFCRENLDLSQSATPDEVRNAIRWVMRDNPDIFWFAHQYHFDESTFALYFQYTFSGDRVRTIQRSINDVIENDFNIEYVSKLTTREQVAYVYKWLVSYCNYNANSAYNQSIYSVFVRRNSVCTGYAKAAQYLFNLLGIESRLVFGRLYNDKENGRHCWNVVRVDNEYYHFDACFGDNILDGVAVKSGLKELFKVDRINYNFLCVSTEEMLQTRSIEDLTTLPECSTSWSGTLVKALAQISVKQREGTRGCLLSHIGSSADIYLCSKEKNTVLKTFRPNSRTTCSEEYRYMWQTKGCQHLLQCNEGYTDITQNVVAIEQCTPIVDLLCSHYYELSLKGLIKMAVDVALAWKECQERGVLYRDIHVCNIYRSNDGTFKLGDFGSCTNDFAIKETVGNQWFMAPETFVSGVFTEASAVYSISMVMYFILNNLRPAFWTPGRDNAAFQKRINGYDLPIPASCINLPYIIKEMIGEVFRYASASVPRERISTIAEFLCLLRKLACCCENSDCIIHRKGVSLSLDLDAGNSDRLDSRWDYISRDAYHRYAMGDDVERMCVSVCYDGEDEECPPIAQSEESLPVDKIEDFACTMAVVPQPTDGSDSPHNVTFHTCMPPALFAKKSWFAKLFGKKYREVYSSIFAPAEVKRKSHVQVQIYLHLYEESEKVKLLAKESDKNAERRDYIPLSLKLTKGDKVDVEFNVYGETRLMSERKSVIWQGAFTKCSFDYFVPQDIDVEELSCEANLFVNGAMIGEMRFITRIVEAPRNLNPEILSHRFSRIFISYAHQDARQIKLLALAYKAQGVDYFYDRDSLAPGDVYEEKIFDYIDSSDLFVLCWSKNAAVSDYVAKEKGRALLLAYPQRSLKEATLKICPISIEPRADLPSDMKEVYNFEVI